MEALIYALLVACCNSEISAIIHYVFTAVSPSSLSFGAIYKSFFAAFGSKKRRRREHLALRKEADCL
jgi:hypothetical protein